MRIQSLALRSASKPSKLTDHISRVAMVVACLSRSKANTSQIFPWIVRYISRNSQYRFVYGIWVYTLSNRHGKIQVGCGLYLMGRRREYLSALIRAFEQETKELKKTAGAAGAAGATAVMNYWCDLSVSVQSRFTIVSISNYNFI